MAALQKQFKRKNISDKLDFSYYSNWKIIRNETNDKDIHFVTLQPKIEGENIFVFIEYYPFEVDFPLYWKDYLQGLHQNSTLKNIVPKKVNRHKLGPLDTDLLTIDMQNEFSEEEITDFYSLYVEDYSAAIICEYPKEKRKEFQHDLKLIAKTILFY